MAIGDFMGMMKQASQLQAKVQEMQAELERIEVEGTAGAAGIAPGRPALSGRFEMVAVDAEGRPRPLGPSASTKLNQKEET